jgi:hypothetical protein
LSLQSPLPAALDLLHFSLAHQHLIRNAQLLLLPLPLPQPAVSIREHLLACAANEVTWADWSSRQL